MTTLPPAAAPPPDGVTIRELDTTDVAELERHVAFEDAHGRARFDVPALRAWLPTVPARVLLAAEDGAGQLMGCATASVVTELGPGSVQVNGFCLPGRADVLRALMDSIERWDGAAAATALFAHVSSPTPDQEGEWLAAGFTREGTRARVERAVVVEDAHLTGPALPAGLAIVPLADRPGLAPHALRVWNETHLDIPTSLTFSPVEEAGWREQLGMDEGDAFPAPLLVAVTPDGDIAGIALLTAMEDEQGAWGHRFTGVARDWRGQGLAAALKVATIRWAAANGVRVLHASNDSGNEPMRAVNRRFGYEEQFRIVLFRRPVARG